MTARKPSLQQQALRLQNAARRRAALDTLAIGLPLTTGIVILCLRIFGPEVAAAVAVGLILATSITAAWRIRRLDRAWLVARLDAGAPPLEDSADLLFRDPAELQGFAALQRGRLERRTDALEQMDLRPPWSRWSIVGAVLVGAALGLAAAFWPSTQPVDAGGRAAPRSAGAPKVTRTRLRIVPPAYTGLPAREQLALDARAPEGSRIEWVIDMAPGPDAAQLVFPGAAAVTLARRGGGWRGATTLTASTLYRLEAQGLERQRLHRLDAVIDAAPVVRIVEPDAQLVLTRPGQTRWTPVFEVTDDYGVAPGAVLRIAVTQGEGENITVKHRTLPMTGRGDGRRKRFSVTLDLAREGLAPGGDMIVQLAARDNRAPAPQTVDGPSVILRWPSAQGLEGGLDGMVRQTLPAYFRSQRQIIIDAEALIADRRRIDADRFQSRSNALGADQAQLRLRYGQFMGEEAEGGGAGGIALPTNDAPSRPALPTNDAPAPAPAAAEADHDHADHDHADHDHEHDAGPPAFGSQMDVTAQFGHVHDTPEAATLFDPGTRDTLRQALNAMWGSERALRQGLPEDALPYAHRALELLKEAQQATRIFLARTGANLPPVDLSRRLSGDRDGIVGGAFAALPDPTADATAADAWRALQERPGPTAPLRLDALDRWVRDNRGRLQDPLALTAAIDTVRNEPDCRPCRARLRALLWTALDRPPPAVQRRTAPDARGRRYLEALQ
ncbi:MAG: DUF4175 domain-containing protein [Brevundimonas sp.]|uniref:DUF4175 family protein n=1 Tax=Brevundimonas sp. TaxID=1871086 RepID=UPI002587583E|nr:DUF4175 family protein [Brevundimonas sp.]MCV0413336.1 DUF4175 domain-containing protein [Brevundimonas sp.]